MKLPARAAAALERETRERAKPGPKPGAKAKRREAPTGAASTVSFRAFLESPDYCGLELSPAIAAIADASEGRRPDVDDALALELFGCPVEQLPAVARRTVAVRAGRRGGKTSRLLAPKALHAAWTVPLPTVRTGEEAAAVIVAPDLDAARQTLSFCEGYVEQSRVLRAALVSSPTKNALALRRPDGRVVQVRVRAASRGGRAGRGFTLVFAALEEACFFYDDSGVVNDREVRRALLPALVPGAQNWCVSTPWVRDVGLLEEMVTKNWGRHEHALVACATTRRLNPEWDPTGEMERSMRDEDPENAAREIDAVPMSGASNAYFDARAIDASVSDVVTPAKAKGPAAMGVDAAFVKDASAGVVVQREGARLVTADVVELRPERGAPLKPSAVAATWAEQARRYGLDRVMGDGHSREAMREHLERAAVKLVSAPEGASGKESVYRRVKTLLHEGRVVLPRSQARLVRQLKDVMVRATPGGGVQILSPRRAGGHGDIVSAWVLAVWQADRLTAAPEAVRETDEERTERLIEARHARTAGEWWEREPTSAGYV